MIECIYCEELKPLSAFNREHVMPEAFGKFEGNNFVLHGDVCIACNSHFGDTIDRALARDSMEGMQRFRSGLMRPTEKHRFGLGRRLRTTLKGSICDGAILEQRARRDRGPGLALYPAAQIGLALTEAGPWAWFRLRELPSLPELRARGVTCGLYVQAFGCTNEEAAKALEDGGYGLPPETKFVSDELIAEPDSVAEIIMHGVIDATTARAVAKIAMNYLTYHYPELARSREFRPIRRFVRFGEGEWRSLVMVTNEPVVASFPREAQVFAHVLTAFWDPASRTVQGQVSLYNWVQCKVLLGYGFGAAEPAVHSAHFFDPVNKVILPLTREKQPMVDLSKHTQIDV
jgi:HNH endonuclease